MAKIKFNPLVEEVHGQFGDIVFREVRGQTILCRKPSTNGDEPTQAQAAQRERFAQAAKYAKAALSNGSREFYEAASEQKGIPAFALCVGDFLNPPSITPMDLSEYQGNVGDPIYIGADDDMGVVKVTVTITSAAAGTIIEKGEATETTPGHWVYTATAAVAAGTDIFVKAVAVDHPGSTAVTNENITVGS